jgi:hypothetical protein
MVSDSHALDYGYIALKQETCACYAQASDSHLADIPEEFRSDWVARRVAKKLALPGVNCQQIAVTMIEGCLQARGAGLLPPHTLCC